MLKFKKNKHEECMNNKSGIIRDRNGDYVCPGCPHAREEEDGTYWCKREDTACADVVQDDCDAFRDEVDVARIDWDTEISLYKAQW